MTSLATFFRNVESEAFWEEQPSGLHIGRASSSPSSAAPAETIGACASERLSPSENDRWLSAGYLELSSRIDVGLAAALARGIATLCSSGLHPTFVYVYDEAWRVLDCLRPLLSPVLGGGFDVLADVWAWHIDPKTDCSGWPIHRGWYDDVRGPDGVPCLLNVWVALTDATERNACMHVVPLSSDPHYPGDLHNLASLENLAVALPIRAASALVWNANAAHWGGGCDPSFHEARISMSFTVRRRGSPPDGLPCLRLPLTFRQRLDLIAEQFETYGERELPPERLEMRWASALRGMREVVRRQSNV